MVTENKLPPYALSWLEKEYNLTLTKKSEDILEHVVLSSSREYPGRQVHWNDPLRLVHSWSHGVVARLHSSISVNFIDIVNENQILKRGNKNIQHF